MTEKIALFLFLSLSIFIKPSISEKLPCTLLINNTGSSKEIVDNFLSNIHFSDAVAFKEINKYIINLKKKK